MGYRIPQGQKAFKEVALGPTTSANGSRLPAHQVPLCFLWPWTVQWWHLTQDTGR